MGVWRKLTVLYRHCLIVLWLKEWLTPHWAVPGISDSTTALMPSSLTERVTKHSKKYLLLVYILQYPCGTASNCAHFRIKLTMWILFRLHATERKKSRWHTTLQWLPPSDFRLDLIQKQHSHLCRKHVYIWSTVYAWYRCCGQNACRWTYYTNGQCVMAPDKPLADFEEYSQFYSKHSCGCMIGSRYL